MAIAQYVTDGLIYSTNISFYVLDGLSMGGPGPGPSGETPNYYTISYRVNKMAQGHLAGPRIWPAKLRRDS